MSEEISGKIKVLVVDDSPLVREIVSTILNSDPSIEVIGTAADGYDACAKVALLKPQVVTMDLMMPRLGGLEAIQRIMEEHPTPILVVSSVNAELAIQALSIGAMDIISTVQQPEKLARELIEKVKIASHVTALRRLKQPRLTSIGHKPRGTLQAIGIGASTGGPQALEMVLSSLPHTFPACILIVQHIAKGFVHGLAEFLRQRSPLEVCVARAGDLLKPGKVLLAPDECHMQVSAANEIALIEKCDGRDLYVPSIDYMLTSLAAQLKHDAIGVLMTGMASEGVNGMRAVKQAGGVTLAQDQGSSIIFGMNRAAIEAGCIDHVCSLEQLAGELLKLTA